MESQNILGWNCRDLELSLAPGQLPTQVTPTIPPCPQSLTAKIYQQMIAKITNKSYWNFMSRLKVKHLPVRKGLNQNFQWLIDRGNVIFSKALKCLFKR